jgi:hypothetical protein
MDEAIKPEDYFRDHAQRLRGYARYASPSASARLIERAQLLDMKADKARERRIAEEQRRRAATRCTNGSGLPRLRRD